MTAFTFGAALWLAVLMLLAWRAMTAVEVGRDVLAWLSLPADVRPLIRPAVPVIPGGEGRSRRG